MGPGEGEIQAPGTATSDTEGSQPSASQAVEDVSTQAQEPVLSDSAPTQEVAVAPEREAGAVLKAAKESATSVLEKSGSKLAELFDLDPTTKRKGFLTVMSAAMAGVYVKASIEGARLLTPDGGAFWDGLMEFARLPTWLYQNNWSHEHTNIIMSSWAALPLAATFAVVTGLSVASLVKGERRGTESNSDSNFTTQADSKINLATQA